MSSRGDYRNELRNKVRDLRDLLTTPPHPNVSPSFVHAPTDLSDILVHDIFVSQDFTVAIDTIAGPEGWRINIFPRHGALAREYIVTVAYARSTPTRHSVTPAMHRITSEKERDAYRWLGNPSSDECVTRKCQRDTL